MSIKKTRKITGTKDIKEDFSAIIEVIWLDMTDNNCAEPPGREHLQLLAECCQIGWNAAAVSSSKAEAIEMLYAGALNLPAGTDSILETAGITIALKFRWCPQHRALIDRVETSIRRKPKLKIRFVEVTEPALPPPASHSLTLNSRTMQKAIRGISPEKLENALAAMQALFNTGPGDLSLYEAFEQARKK